MVVRPSEIAPTPMYWICRILHDEVKLPPRVFNVVHGSEEVVEALIDHPDVQGVAFVGSIRVAGLVYERAGRRGRGLYCRHEPETI